MTRRRLTTVLAVLALAPFALGACGGDDGDGGGGGDTAGGGGGGGGAMAGNAEAGAEVFASAGCGGCHTLAAANSSGTTGPNLDDLKPSEDQVAEQVRNGGGGMPAFGDKLSDQEIADVAAFVSTNAGQS